MLPRLCKAHLAGPREFRPVWLTPGQKSKHLQSYVPLRDLPAESRYWYRLTSSHRRCLVGEQTCSAWLISHVWILSWILFLNSTPSKLFKVDLTFEGYSVFFDHWKSNWDAKWLRSKKDTSQVPYRLCLSPCPEKSFSPSPFRKNIVPPTMDSSLLCLERRFPHPRPALDLERYPHFLH